MRPVSVLCLLSFVLPFAAFAAPTDLSPATTETSPIQLLTDFQRTYLYENDYAARAKIMQAGKMNNQAISEATFSGGSPVTLSWSGTSGTCTVSVKRLSDEKVVYSKSVSGTSLTIYNLEIDAGYTWTVTDSSNQSASATFWTSPEPPRLIKTGAMKVMRDLGGWTGFNGCKVRQNQLFRGGPATGVDEDAEDFFYNVVGVKTELDLRGTSSDKFDASGTKLAYYGLSRDASYYVERSKMGDTKWENLKSTFKYIFDSSKRPAYFHCSIGRDRTGITAELALALLGVSLEDIWRDYETSAYKQSADIVSAGTYFAGYVRDMAAYKSGYATFNEQVEAYFIEDLGFTAEQIETFRTEMLIGYGEETPDPGTDPGGDADDPVAGSENIFSVSPYVQHPDTNAMTIVFFTTKSCKAKVRVWRVNGTDDVTPKWTEGVDVSATLGPNPYGSEKSKDEPTYDKQYKHRVRFDGLAVHADYRYRVMPEGGVPYENAFRTLPDKNTPVRFIGYCDCETTPKGAATDWSNNGGQSKYFVGLTEGFASNLVHIAREKPDLITISGDIAAKGGYQKNWDEFWRQNAGFNAKGDGYNDLAGSIPILAAIGNHDLKEDSGVHGTDAPLNRYLTYFEYNPNGVQYEYSDGTTTPETRDMSQLFHREDLGPATLIFLDTNKGAKGKNKDSTQDGADRPQMRSPDFHPGSLQYAWLTNNLADAQRNSKFTFVINHHCPYSVGQHNRPSDGGGYDGYDTGKGCDGESAQAVRCLTETMIQYGVDAWLCGHDEIMEHSQTNGFEVFPDGRRRAHTLNVYDLGSGGDGLRGEELVKNPIEVFRAFKDSGEKWENGILVEGGCHYGFMEVDVTTNKLGKWMCSLTPKYDFIYKDKSGKVSGFELRAYKDRIIIDEESDKIIYQEWSGDRTLPEHHAEYVRPPEGPSVQPPPPYERVKPYVRAIWSQGETKYRRIEK